MRPLMFILISMAMDLLGRMGIAAALKIRVADDFTHVVVSQAVVLLAESGGESKGIFSEVGNVSNGFFSLVLTNQGARYQFELRAEGYAPFKSKVFVATNGLPLFDVEMDRQFDFEGFIVAPTGQAAAGALYYLCTDPAEVTFRRDRTFYTRFRPPFEAGAKGRIRLSPELTAHSILVAHDLGYAQAPLAGWTNGARIQLRPWGRVAGEMRINDAIAPKERVTLTATAASLGRTKMTLLDFTAITDAQGRFAFENVPPVEVALSWQIARPEGLVNSHSLVLEADANKTANLVFDLKGRTISGSFRCDAKPAAISARLVSKPGEVPLELWKAGSGLQSPEFRQTLALIAKPDLTFRGIAIPPGDYLVEAQLYDQETARQSSANLRGRLSVPPGQGTVDVGEVELRRN